MAGHAENHEKIGHIVQVVFEVPTLQHFDYLIPEALQGRVMPGSVVLAPFHHRKSNGYVINIVNQSPHDGLKYIEDILEEYPVLSPGLLKLAQWISDYYLCSQGMVFKTMLPAPVRKRSIQKKSIIEIPKSALEHMDQTAVLDAMTIKLEAQQEIVLKDIYQAIDKNLFEVLLLHGITGSGKTEVYLRAMAACLEKNRTALLLLPEITLTPQMIFLAQKRFPDQVAVLHSSLSDSERIIEWQKIKNQKVSLVLGVRSAVFAPLSHLGLIIVDEEHERSYKQEDGVPYHARDVAIMRAKIEGCPIILGSATPSLETFQNALKKKYVYLSMPERIGKKSLAQVELIDMKRDIYQIQKGFVFSDPLLKQIEQCLKNQKQVILFLNRRGYAPFSICTQCKKLAACPHCSRALTWHKADKVLLCHICNHKRSNIHFCENCHTATLRAVGMGTQKIEDQLLKIFPKARIQRVDRDSMRKKNAAWKMWSEFQNGSIDILIGTQIIAKGFDFPNVTLVGVIYADIAMGLPDFRSGEFTFQLLTQVAGRAGRGADTGRVLIQTFTPEHPILQCALVQDYKKFFNYESQIRKELLYPPFNHLIHLVFSGKNESQTRDICWQFGSELKKYCDYFIRLYGPNPAPISKEKDSYRFQIILMGSHRNKIKQMVMTVREKLASCWSSRVQLRIDVDPMGLY